MSERTQAIVVTIDGPAASGKTSVSRLVAQAMGWKWVSTGAFYRGLAYVAQREGIDLESPAQLVKLAESSLWRVEMAVDSTQVWYKSQQVSDQVASENVGEVASRISHFAEVRKALLGPQRQCALKSEGLIAEGRDCGSVVFPNARLKVYLTATSDNRASRRALEQGVDMESTLRMQKERDRRDSNRTAAPLQVPSDGVVIDTSPLALEQVVQSVLGLIRQYLGLIPKRPPQLR